MSELLLERLSKKTTKQKMKPIEIKLDKGQVAVQVAIVKSNEEYDMELFKQKLLKRGLQAPKLFIKPAETKEEIKEEETDINIPQRVKPKKIGKTTLPGDPKKSKPKKIKKKQIIEEIILDIPATLIQIDDRQIGDRLSKIEPSVNIKSPAYYLNNREYFINFLNSIFHKYNTLLKDQSKEDISCESLSKSKSKNFSLMIHQQIVRDYMNIYTPYRGLLLYHGLGAGKTCASIGIAEGLKNTNQVIIMTPASLRMNYISELKHCGDPIYKINQYWEKVVTSGNPHMEKALSDVLNLPVSYIRKQGWVWMVDVKKASNFETLSPDDQKSIDNQINEMLLKKYKFINYNGMREDHLDNMILQSEQLNNTSNPFDDKVIIIDEAHNFVSRIVNKLKVKKTSLSTRLYELILDANNCRVVFLTGTPIINYPNEIGVLFNMLRGYIKTFYIKIDTSETTQPINQKYILDIFKKEKLLDYVEYVPSQRTLIITRNPFGFTNKAKKKGSKIIYAGVNNKSKFGLQDDNKFLGYITKTLKNNNIVINRKLIQVENHKALPDLLETFKDMFIDPVTGEMKQKNMFMRRIIGLTSYFRSAQESLLPRYEETPKYYHIEKIPMSAYQVGVYEKARAAERKEEDRNARKKAKQKEGIYADTTSTYRIFSRAFCNFVFPNEIVLDTEGKEVLLSRPMPKSGETLEQTIQTSRTSEKKTKSKDSINKVDEDIMDAVEIQDKLENQDGLYTRDDVTEIQQQVNEQTDDTYKKRIETALNLLVENGDKYFSPTGLSDYSPKFKRVLQNIISPSTTTKSDKGLHLVYSQFRTIEGIGILSLILEQNGFTKFKISKKTGTWKLDISEENRGKPTYALYTGTETAEEKEIIRNVFNSSWDSIPSTLSLELQKINKNNYLGEIIKVLMITSSGSEGITLKNTRFVHLIEPYWHPVRTDQVIGRARRICSHKDLPDDLKTVEVFVYLMTFTEKQIMGDREAPTKEKREPLLSRALINSKSDKSRIDRTTILTSDESLFEISNIKKNTTNSILRAIKSSSIDCALHYNSNKKEGFACYSFGSPSVNAFSYKPSYSSEERDTIESQNLKGVTWKAYPIKLGGIKYAHKRTDPNNKKIGEFYDFDSYITARDNPSVNPILMGRLDVDPKNSKRMKIIYVNDPDF